MEEVRDLEHFWHGRLFDHSIDMLIPARLPHGGSFENEALENEDRSTKHPNLENEAPKTRKRSTLDRKRRPPNLESEAPKIENEAPKSRKRRPQNSKTKHLNQVEVADASTPPKVHKIHPKVL